MVVLYLEAGDKGSAEGLSLLGLVPFNMFVSDLGKAMECLLIQFAMTPNGQLQQGRRFRYSQGKGCHSDIPRQGWSRPTGTL